MTGNSHLSLRRCLRRNEKSWQGELKKILYPGNSFFGDQQVPVQLIRLEMPANGSACFLKKFGHLPVAHRAEVHHRLAAGGAEPSLLVGGHLVPMLVTGLRDAELYTFHTTVLNELLNDDFFHCCLS